MLLRAPGCWLIAWAEWWQWLASWLSMHLLRMWSAYTLANYDSDGNCGGQHPGTLPGEVR